jgi:phage FluMu gp28-like protein
MVGMELRRERFYRFLVENGLVDEFEDFAYEVYSDDREELVVEKSRQVGISFALSIRMLCDALFGGGWVVFSESKDEAYKKVGLCRLIVDKLEGMGYGVDVVSKSRSHISFSSGGYIEALSYRGTRGRGYSGNVFIDECFWVPNMEELLNRIRPVLVRIGGRLRMAGTSSYRGHYLYSSGVIRDSDWRRIYWWDSRYFCRDVELARKEALGLSTRERVYRFGNGNLVRLYESYGSDIEFAREFECYVGDIEGGVVGYDRLMSLVDMELDGGYYEGLVGFAQFLEDVGSDRSFYVGVDIGRRVNHTEIVLVDFDGNVLYNIDLGCVGFDEQRRVLEELLERRIAYKMVIDSSGLGMDLVEDLSRRYENVVGLVFTSENKSLMVRNFSRLVSSGGLRFAYLRDLLKHILDVRVEVSSVGNILYKSASSRHNCDKFWALCLALYGYGGSGLFYEGVSEFNVLPNHILYGTVIDRVRYGNRLLRRLL